MGGAPTLVVGTTARGLRDRAVVRFDIAEKIPAGATITFASLRLQVTKAPGTPVNSTFELHRLLVSWGEGNKDGLTGAPAASGEATWNLRFSPGSPWSKPGGADGTDFAGTVSGSVEMQGTGSYTFASSTGLVADVQFWLDRPDSNFGWLCRSRSESAAETSRRVASREDSANAPVLQVEYTSPAVPLRITQFTVESQRALLTWTGGSPPYQVQTTDGLSVLNWSDIGNTLQTNTLTIPLSSGPTFFRIRAAQ